MRRSHWALGLCISMLALGCPGQKPIEAPSGPKVAQKEEEEKIVWRPSKSGLGFRLSQVDGDGPQKRAKEAVTTPLDDKETQALLARVAPIKDAPEDVVPFALRAKSLPPPITGETVKEPFPPPPGPPPAEVVAGPLKVERALPKGDVPIAPHLAVTFSHPMVPLTSHAELSNLPSPVKLTPTPKGEWRWLGTQTVMFQPDPRFPMATEYTVDIPAGTRAMNGKVLEKAEHFTFKTPPPRVLAVLPDGSQNTEDPLLYVELDQEVDPAKVLPHVRLSGGGLSSIPLRLATEAEIEKDKGIAYRLEKAEKGRAFAFKADRPLPLASSYSLNVQKGTPSAEGPIPTPADHVESFGTYGPMQLRESSCPKKEPCEPADSFYLSFTNGIQAAAFEPAQVEIVPPLPHAKITTSGSGISIQGHKKGRTVYRVTVKAGLRDVFGQTLAKDAVAELHVGRATPAFFEEDRPMRVQDPGGKPETLAFTVNHKALKASLYQVDPKDFAAYEKFRRDWDYYQKMTPVPGKLVGTKILTVKNAPDELVETPVDLSPALRGGVGNVVVIVEPTVQPKKPEYHEWSRQWVQVTKLGVTTIHEPGEGIAWVTDLATGAAVTGAKIALDGVDAAVTSGDGLAHFKADSVRLLTARRGDDVAFLGGHDNPFFHSYTPYNDVRWFSFDDRKLYKPGEEVHVKGWLRNVDLGKKGDVTFPRELAGKDVTFTAYDGRGNEIAKGKADLDPSFGFDLAFKIPDNGNLGYGRVSLRCAGESHSHDFRIEEFRRPEFEVSMSTGEGPHAVGKHAIATVSAKYFSGGGLPNAETTWTVSSTEGHFTPPNRSDFQFGRGGGFWYGYFRRGRYGYGSFGRGRGSAPSTETLSGATGPDGVHRVRVDFDGVTPSFPRMLSLDARVKDVNRQEWSAHGSMLVHPSNVYVGLKLAKSYLRQGEAIRLSAIAADLDGKAVLGRKLSVESARLETEQKGAEWIDKEVDQASCELDSAEEPRPCELATKGAGLYRVRATVVDEFGRKNQTESDVYVYGDTEKDRDLKSEAVTIVPDKKEYAQGDTAELLVMSPIAPAEALLTLERAGVVRERRFRITKTTETVQVKLDGDFQPGATVHIHVVGSAVREDAQNRADASLPRRPAYGQGTAALSIPAVDRKIQVAVKPRVDRVDPGAKVTADVTFTKANGEPLPEARAALAVVDESILALAGYELPDPMAAFYPARGAGTTSYENRGFVRIAEPGALKEREESNQAFGRGGLGLSGIGEGGGGRGSGMGYGAAPGAPIQAAKPAASAAPRREMAKSAEAKKDKGRAGDAAEAFDDAPDSTAAIQVRKDFRALVAFLPKVTADGRGKAEVSFTLPDSLTRYRIMAVAVHGEREFGKGEGTVTARLPLMVRPSPPRFLNFGDVFELPVVLQNQTDKPMTVKLAARSTNAVLDDPRGRKVVVPAQDRVEVRLPARAKKPGRARFQIASSSGDKADAAEVDLPVWTPATTEAFATYGVVDKGAVAQTVTMPRGVVTEFGGLEVSTSSTALQALTDAVLYLVKYPYDCAEQRASRVLAIAALRDVLSAFKAKGMPAPEAVLASMNVDLAELKALQKWNGGWGYWRSREDDPFVTLHVMHALVRAEQKGYKPDASTRARGLSYLQSIESHIPHWYSRESRRAIVAYALFVRELLGNRDSAKAHSLIAEAKGVENLSMEALGWLLPTLDADPSTKSDAAQILAFLANRVTETAGAAHFTSSYSDGAHVLLHSDRRDDGVLLDALIRVDPKNTVIPKIVTGLLAHRKRGHWGSTNDNAFVLLALDRYFNTYEKTTPDFVARAWLGSTMVAEHAFRGRTTERDRADVPMSFLAQAGDKPQSFVVGKEGEGRMYYRVGMQYAPADLRPPPIDRGFVVTRSYEGADDPKDVSIDKSGVWHVKAGARVRVRVTMVAPARRYHVALVDPLPAGFEPMNPALKMTGPVPEDNRSDDPSSRRGRWWWGRWYEHENMRDERVEAFTSLLWEGVHEYVYVARATTPGDFVVPPPRAEEMYMPETFGRGPGDRVEIR
ncbi:MAG: hypothetical protein IPK71_30450 [Myxococcales bacterium]|nr:hypothetical protein [Myxococcales bacterium]